MRGLNNLINNNVQLQRLDDINNMTTSTTTYDINDNDNNNNNNQQHYNPISNLHLIATSYNHHVNSTYEFI